MEDRASLRFGRFELQPDHRRLLRDGEPVTVGARPFDLLLALVDRRERVVTKAELLDLVWPGLVVEENNLQVQVSLLRKLLGVQAIATVPGRGYRFTAGVDGQAPPRADAAEPGSPGQLDADHATRRLPTNLPRVLPRLYGRETDLQALRSLFDAHGLVTVVGAGGIGKSRLAQSLALTMVDHWPDGVWLVELAGLSDPGLLPNVMAQVLGIPLVGRQAAFDELVTELTRRKLLLVLDNCEHLIDAVAALAQAITRDAPEVRLLLTSQQPLHLPTEQQYRLLPLAVPIEVTTFAARAFGAVALFEARVCAVDSRFGLNGEKLALVIDICRRLDGLPLAIELAAARVGALGLRTVRDNLDARFMLLTGGSRAAMRRHQTLRAALEWSHELLDDAERTVFKRLGVFAGGFTMALAQGVASDAQLDGWAVLDHLGALVDKSLVAASADDPPRYRLLESARAFALERLGARETVEVLERHALAVRDLFAKVDGANLDGELRTEELDALLVPELDNLRAAHAWAIREGGALPVAVVLAASASSLDDFAVECVDWLVPLRIPVEAEAVEPTVAARYWRAIASANMSGRVALEFQLDAASRARSLYLAQGQPRRAFSSLVQLARYRFSQQDDEAAQAAADEARKLLQPDWPATLRIRLLRMDGYLARRAGRLGDALALFREAVRASAATRDWLLEVIARSNLSDLLWLIGPVEEAAREALQLAQELRVRPTAHGDMAWLLSNLMGILSEMGRIDEASAVAREALPLMQRDKTYHLEAWAYLFWRRRQFDTATMLVGASEAERRREIVPLQENELRLMTEARVALEARIHPDELTRGLAAGASLREPALLELITTSLARPVAADR